MTNDSQHTGRPSADLNAMLEALRQEVWLARDCWEAWWSMKARPYRGKYNDVFGEYGEYFAIAIHSHFTALLFALWRLYDPGPRATSLQTLPGHIGPQGGVSHDALRKYRMRLRGVRRLIASVEILRHKLFAHRDPSYSVERAFKEANLKHRDLRTLVDTSAELLAILLDARRLGTIPFEQRVQRDVVRLIRQLHHVAACTSNKPFHLTPGLAPSGRSVRRR